MQPNENKGKSAKIEKMTVFSKKGLRVWWTGLRTHFTGGAEAHNGTRQGRRERRSWGSEAEKFWG